MTISQNSSDRESARAYLDREIARPNPEFSTYDPEWLRDYQRHVRRWIDCAPEGAIFLIAPLQGWNGEPCGGRPALGAGILCNPAYRKVVQQKHGVSAVQHALNIYWGAREGTNDERLSLRAS